MNTLNKVLDKSAELCGSDSATARKAHVSRQAVSKWRHGGKIDPEHLARLLEITQQDPAIAVQVLAEQQTTPEESRLWAILWDRLSPVTTTVAGVLLITGLWAPLPSQASESTNLNNSHFIHYAQLRRMLRAAFASMARRFGALHASPMLA